MKTIKTAKQYECYFKGVANHRRVEILIAIDKSPGITLDQLATKLRCNAKTFSEHCRKLTQALLIEKKYNGSKVQHFLTPYGKKFILFLKSF